MLCVIATGSRINRTLIYFTVDGSGTLNADPVVSQ